MRKAERIKYIIDTLERLYPTVQPPLDHTSAYTLLVAVLLSAQCTDERVNQVTERLFKLAANPYDMVACSEADVLDIVRPCGLGPTKAKHIKQLSQILVTTYGGEVPADLAALEKLPGVGHKTASVVMNQAFGVPTFPVDTHIHRLAKRWKISNGSTVVQTEKDCKKSFPQLLWGKLHLQIIFYARQYCTAYSCKTPSCDICMTISGVSVSNSN